MLCGLVRAEVHTGERALPEPLRGGADEREAARLAVRLEEASALDVEHAELEGLVEDDRPRHHGQDEEHREDNLLERTDVGEDLAETTKTGKPCHDAQTLESLQRALCNQTSCNVSAIIPSGSEECQTILGFFRAIPARCDRAFRLTPLRGVG